MFVNVRGHACQHVLCQCDFLCRHDMTSHVDMSQSYVDMSVLCRHDFLCRHDITFHVDMSQSYVDMTFYVDTT